MLLEAASGIPASRRGLDHRIPWVATIRDECDGVILCLNCGFHEGDMGWNVETGFAKDVDCDAEIGAGIQGAFLDCLGEVVQAVQNVRDPELLVLCGRRSGRHLHRRQQHRGDDGEAGNNLCLMRYPPGLRFLCSSSYSRLLRASACHACPPIKTKRQVSLQTVPFAPMSINSCLGCDPSAWACGRTASLDGV